MTLYESTIYAGLKRLIKLIYTAKYLSTKADRINYIEPNIRYLEKSLCNFIMDFNYQDKRRDYMDECIGSFGVFRVLFEPRVINRVIKRAKELNKCIRVDKIEKVLQTINSYLGICKNTCGYNQALRIVNTLSDEWKQYITFNSHRCCLEALPEYSYRNRIIVKYKLNEKRRKRRAAPSSKRAAA